MYDETEMDLLEYSYKSIRNDLVKLFLLTGIATLTGVLKEFLVTLFTISSIRVFIGGIHKNSFWGCFIFSFIYISLSMGVALLCQKHTVYLFAIMVITMFVPLNVSPVSSNKKKLLDEQRKALRKKHGLTCEIFFIVVAIALRNPLYRACIYSGVINSNLQLLYIKMRR